MLFFPTLVDQHWNFPLCFHLQRSFLMLFVNPVVNTVTSNWRSGLQIYNIMSDRRHSRRGQSTAKAAVKTTTGTEELTHKETHQIQPDEPACSDTNSQSVCLLLVFSNTLKQKVYLGVSLCLRRRVRTHTHTQRVLAATQRLHLSNCRSAAYWD